MNILLTGSKGYIGSGIIRYLKDSYNITSINRGIFDLRDSNSTKKWFSKLDYSTHFDVVIHTAISGGNRLKTENSDDLYNNLLMFDNLLDHKDRFSKLISFGSGAEFSAGKSPYGLSKKIINNFCNQYDNFYNLRLYALFDSYEDDRRFIKSNIKRYLNKEDMIIYHNKYMDFIYFGDFIKIVQKYIDYENMPKILDCVYSDKYMLTDIAKIINQLDNYTVGIDVKNTDNDTNYTGTYHNVHIRYDGLIHGITETYTRLKNEQNMVCS